MPSTGDFERGELFATVRNIDNNVNAVRTEMTALNGRVTHVEQNAAADKAQREVRVQQYEEFKEDTSKKIDKLTAEMQKIAALEASVSALRDSLELEASMRRQGDKKVDDLIAHKNEMKGVLRSIKVVWGVVLLLTGVVITQVWIDYRTNQQVEQPR